MSSDSGVGAETSVDLGLASTAEYTVRACRKATRDDVRSNVGGHRGLMPDSCVGQALPRCSAIHDTRLYRTSPTLRRRSLRLPVSGPVSDGTRNPSVDLVARLARALEIDLGVLFEGLQDLTGRSG